MLGRKYWAEGPLSEHSAKKDWGEGSTQLTLVFFISSNKVYFSEEDV